MILCLTTMPSSNATPSPVLALQVMIINISVIGTARGTASGAQASLMETLASRLEALPTPGHH